MNILPHFPSNQHPYNPQNSTEGMPTPPEPNSPADNGNANDGASTETTATNTDAAQTHNEGPRPTAERLSRPTRAIDGASSPQKQSGKEPAPVEKPKTDAVPRWINTAFPNVSAQTQNNIIFGTDTVLLPDPNFSQQNREQRLDAYTGRVSTQLLSIESGQTESERNTNFRNIRPFLTPQGFFSGGLMSSGCDPNEKITVTFVEKRGMHGSARADEVSRYDNTYSAWQVAAGVHKHDQTNNSGHALNYTFELESSAAKEKIKELESLGGKLQSHWDEFVAPNTVKDPYEFLAERSGKADAQSIRENLERLRKHGGAFKEISAEGRAAVNRTLDQNGQVIIPNIYGYPLARHAFIPYAEYDGNYDSRPNQGLMADLDSGAISEIHGDNEFAAWAGRNRVRVLQSFNPGDRQGGIDVHWPRADEVLDNLIQGNDVTYPGYSTLVSDKLYPNRELFNYTMSRGGDYQLKQGALTTSDGDKNGAGIASQYQAVNRSYGAWADQTQVFGASQQNWKGAKEVWANTFGYVPIAGNIGNVVFGVHDAESGMTADDRREGGASATVSGLALAHEVAPVAVEATAGLPPSTLTSSPTREFSWKFNLETREFALSRSPRGPHVSGSPTGEGASANKIGDTPSQSPNFKSPTRPSDVAPSENDKDLFNYKDSRPNADNPPQTTDASTIKTVAADVHPTPDSTATVPAEAANSPESQTNPINNKFPDTSEAIDSETIQVDMGIADEGELQQRRSILQGFEDPTINFAKERGGIVFLENGKEYVQIDGKVYRSYEDDGDRFIHSGGDDRILVQKIQQEWVPISHLKGLGGGGDNIAVRRMDSLARLLHSYTREMREGTRTNPVVTAVGLQQDPVTGEVEVSIAHNVEDHLQRAEDERRLILVRDIVISNKTPESVARELAGTSGLPNRRPLNMDARNRLIRDLKKLRATYQGKYDGRPGAAELKEKLQVLFGTQENPKDPKIVSYTNNGTGRGVVHGETALVSANIEGAIGVSKLSCGDCFDYAVAKERNSNLRDTHGQRFPGWKNPDTQEVSRNKKITGTDQYPNDSESEAE
ncbi:TPA: hypothetical protein QDC03_007473 [Burkholderia cepacia]|uniref:hypothetical protein n=1 Tax=Burkholderia cepacia TaxID=292 RepID=UPI0011B26E13|nr:hypothetical protein [Burkholderia cepacia]HDR9512206.1 hypothetical protein [Burkholderia cepacia]